MKAADARTQLLYAATTPAELTISAGVDCSVWYTTDGSDPSVNGNTAKKLDGSTLAVTPPSTTQDSEVTVRAIAEKNGKISPITEKTVQFVAIPALTKGTRVYLGEVTDGGVSGGPYRIGVRVTTIDGKIARLEDNGTVDGIDDDYDYSWWYGYSVMDEDEGMPSKVKGKTLLDLLNMKTVPDDEDHNADAVSGATVWSDAIRHAAIAALRSKPISESESTVTAPTLLEQTCVPNADYKYIDVTMSAEEGCTIRYTLNGTDPTKDSPEAAAIGYLHDKTGVRLTPDLEKHPEGQIFEVRAAAFDEDGNRSDVVRQFYVFANPLSNAAYTAQYTGISATVGDITATAKIESPNYDNNYYITSLTLDREHSEAYAAFLPELFSRIYLAQTTDGVQPIEEHKTESEAVLAAVKAALDQALTASRPTLSVTPQKTTYANADEVTVTLGCPTDGAEIYYTVDNSRTMTGSTVSDPTKTGTKYDGSFNVSIGHIDGGTVHVCAAAKKDGKWSAITRKDLTFDKGIRDTFTVNGQNYLEWSEAVKAVNAITENATITINDDVTLTADDVMPSVPCTIRSAEGFKYTLSSSSPLTLNADLTLDNIKYAAKQQPLYANGHNLTIGKDVEASYWTGFDLFAGNTADSSADTQSITVQSGTFNVIASGSADTTHSASVNVKADGSAVVTLIGADTNAKLNGNIQFTVETGARLDSFYGEKSGGTISGDLTLKLVGTPTLSAYRPTFKASEDRTDLFGTLDLSKADSEFITNYKDKFLGFETVVLPTEKTE